jgi:hypothetical protein
MPNPEIHSYYVENWGEIWGSAPYGEGRRVRRRWRLCNRCQKKRSAQAFSIVGHFQRWEIRPSNMGGQMLKILTATAASLAMLGAAAAADLPRKEPPPPAPPVGKAPIGKYPVGKAPIGKYPQPVVTKG